ncbi:hypothetical protein EJV47_16330 [Hymenobacter gummosus]|uniref:Uncharacterized protein n=1 Tax=Hymenobacter gummosus TaxID=1776032 RepID=A0A431U0U9_9BACT|nr:hypothetical protein [Hymenobacter gummosus]RTQ48538.1 hypothetical protein EJV47_16330 [Hymenobacter gummosus]
MKTLRQQAPRFVLLAAFAALGFTAPAQAATPAENGQPVCVDKVADFTYLVRVSNPAQRRARLQVVRISDGAVLHEESSRKPSFGEKLNVKQLPDGDYALVVELNNTTHRYPINLRTTVQRNTMVSLATPEVR